MEKVLNSGAAEVAPPPTSTGCWYLPLFGVRNPKKPDQIRGVFDSSAKYGGVSLNFSTHVWSRHDQQSSWDLASL